MRIPLMVLAGAAVALLATAQPVRAQDRLPDIETFVRLAYVHGVPFEMARAYGPEAVPRLVGFLENPVFEPHWVNVVYTLGYIGDERALEPLIAFLERQRGEITPQAFRAVLGVMPALGHLAREGSDRALEVLSEFLQTGQIDGDDPGFSYAIYVEEALVEVLGRLTIQGLGISGRPEALDLLTTLQSADLRPDWEDNVDEALVLNRRVAREGAARVFGTRTY
jgi:hypothetical protein